jgi:hypothetical protein
VAEAQEVCCDVSCTAWGATEACADGTWLISRFTETTPMTMIPSARATNVKVPTLRWTISDDPDERCHWDPCRDANSCETVPEHPTGLSVGYGTSPNAEGNSKQGVNGVRRCGPASQSTIGDHSPDDPNTARGEPGAAIDGNTNTHLHADSCMMTDLLPAWWQVDLGQRSTVTKVNVWHRTDCCQDRLNTAQVYVSDTPDFGNGHPCSSPLSADGSNPESTMCAGDGDMGGATGRYVTVYLQKKDEPDFIGYTSDVVFTICELEVSGIVYTEAVDDAQAACCTGPCAPGTRNDDGWCEPCEAGTFSATTDAECTPCGVGEYAEEGASECRTCAVGQFDHDGSAATACVPCEAGRFQEGGSQATVCNGRCSSGSYAAKGVGVCVPCAVGRHDHDANGATPCRLCRAATFASEPGAVFCASCAPGRSSIGGSSNCTTPQTPYMQEQCPTEWEACAQLPGCSDSLAAALAAPVSAVPSTSFAPLLALLQCTGEDHGMTSVVNNLPGEVFVSVPCLPPPCLPASPSPSN